MKWQVTESPSTEPLDVSDVKDHLHYELDFTARDAVLKSYISAARIWAENHMERALADQEITVKLNRFPESRNRAYLPKRGPRIPLPMAGATEITSIKYTDTDGAEKTLSTDVYALDSYGDPNAVYLQDGKEWPTDVADEENAVEVVYRAGEDFSETGVTLQDNYKKALILLVGHWDVNQEAVLVGSISKPIEFTVESLLGQKRVMGL